MTSITADHIAILLGILFIIFASYHAYRLYKLLKIGISVSATIIDFITHSKRRGYTMYFPILEFNTNDGERIHVKSYIGYDQSNQKQVGEMIDIIYNPTEPNQFLIKRGRDLYIKIIGAILIGLIFIVAGNFKFFSYTP